MFIIIKTVMQMNDSKFISFIVYFLIFFAICLVLVGDASAFSIAASVLSGAFIAWLITFKLGYVFSPKRLGFARLLRFIVFLIPAMYISAFKTFLICIKSRGNPKTGFVTCRLETEDEFHRHLICQAITLTPGTVVSEKRDDTVQVLTFTENEGNPAEDFDNILKKRPGGR